MIGEKFFHVLVPRKSTKLLKDCKYICISICIHNTSNFFYNDPRIRILSTCMCVALILMVEYDTAVAFIQNSMFD